MKRFPDNARVCFVGDSITHNGLFVKHIVATYRNRFPESGVEFYNCGISGGNLGNTIAVYHEDIAIYDPTHIVLMIGVNDSNRGALAEPRSGERYERLRAAYERFAANYERFYELTRERGIELTVCTPMPYEEYMESDQVPLRGGYALIQAYAEFVRNFARVRGIALCDYHAEATRYMQEEVLYSPDRVHPTARGHEVMAKTFLATQGIEMESTPESTKELDEWYDTVQKLRNVIAAEYLAGVNYLELTDEERYAAMSAKHDAIERGESDLGIYTEYIGSLICRYLESKPHQAEYIEFVKEFMKSGK